MLIKSYFANSYGLQTGTVTPHGTKLRSTKAFIFTCLTQQGSSSRLFKKSKYKKIFTSSLFPLDRVPILYNKWNNHRSIYQSYSSNGSNQIIRINEKAWVIQIIHHNLNAMIGVLEERNLQLVGPGPGRGEQWRVLHDYLQ